MLLSRVLEALVKTGSVTVIDARGDRHTFEGRAAGDAGPARKVTIRIHDRATERRILLSPSLAAGEAYMDGRLTIEDGTLYDFLDICTKDLGALQRLPYYRLANALGNLARLATQINPVGRSRRNVAHHYDLSGTLYDLFLDADRQYSCAYFAYPGQSLEEAQLNKKRHLAAKLVLDRPGLRVLDIGCGWGGLALSIAAQSGAQVTGITLSQEQLKVARERARRAGLADRVKFELRDYRDETGEYDRIVSVGMFEHVGVPQYPAFFRRVRDLLAPDGIALLHAIGRSDGPGFTNPWIQKYIFPGGYCPALSEVLPVMEKLGLVAADIEILRLHYAETLRAWRARFMRNREKVKALYDERFCRMWEFYLVGAELAFRNQHQMVFQIQFARHQEAVPLTRDYIYEWEHRKGAASEHGRSESAA